MKITIDDKVLSKYKLTKEQFFFMLSLVYKVDDSAIDSLLKKKFYISQSYGAGCVPQHNYFLAHAGVDVVNKILLESEHLGTNQKERLDNLAKSLQALYPEGKKAGTNNYWRGNVPEIRDRLQMFLKRFDDYPDEVIIKATENYVESFNMDTRLMKTLKYFISKKRDDGSTEYDLLTFIENIDSSNTDVLKTTTLI